MINNKVIPLSDLAERCIGHGEVKRPILKMKGVFDVCDRGKKHIFSGSLKPCDVDMIRYLKMRGVMVKYIQALFGVSSGAIGAVIYRRNFVKHISPFEKIVDGINLTVCPVLLKKFEDDFSKEIKEVMDKINGLEGL